MEGGDEKGPSIDDDEVRKMGRERGRRWRLTMVTTWGGRNLWTCGRIACVCVECERLLGQECMCGGQ